MKRRLLSSNVILVTTVLLFLMVPLAIVYSRHEHDALMGSLQRDAGSLGSLSEEVVEHPGGHDVPALASRFSTGVGGDVVILDRNGVQLAAVGSASTDQRFRAALLSARTGRAVTGELGGKAYVALPVGSGGDSHGAILIARSDAGVDRQVHRFWLVLVGIGVGVLGVSVLVSRWLAIWAIDPLRRLEANAAELGRGQLDVRADTGTGPPEVVALATTFNEMADRLDELVASQRRFVADASHQLRTPLTALRLRLENLVIDDGTDAASTTREAALLETARLTRLVDGLLALAQADGRRPERQDVEVAGVVAQRFDAWAPLAAEHDVDLRFDSDAQANVMLVPGDLDQILDNLIDNALDATPRGRAVELRTTATSAAVEIHVVDEGRGMTVDERRRAFDPFWQGPRPHANGGTGLGLAIVDQLVRVNGGTIVLARSEHGGIDAVLHFPRSVLPPPERG
ncbi:MAG: putative two-component system sensor kinase [Acidimicrobiales bacterium]|jgi:signal transduction histidine kinase|nr:putative two-component system sensor kinase [Acidimicrobiales bacterium]